jgi:hypothetical protein
MNERGAAPATEPYSPRRRTALLLSGTGTAGAYHAGVLRALHEAGVKVDIVAGRGVGAVGALFAAVDGAQRLWDAKGFWLAPAVRGFYPWRTTLRFVVWTLGLAMALVAMPLAAAAAGLLVFPIDLLVKMVGAAGAGGLTAWYLRSVESAFAPEVLPTWLPRLVLLVLGLAGVLAAIQGYRLSRLNRPRGAFWWRLLPGPLSVAPVLDRCWTVLWDLVRGATGLRQPDRIDLARRYVELLSDNLGQPGFRELVMVVHDLDVGRDLVFALVGESRRRELLRRRGADDAEARRAEIFDLAGLARDHVSDALAAALTVPLATEPHVIQFAADAHWRGERHRLLDRTGALHRVVAELVALDVQQIVLVTGAPESAGPHQLAASRLDGRGRMGAYLQSSESATVRDVVAAAGDGWPHIFIVRPAHNPLGPFDFTGGFDDRSHRRSTLAELMALGYEDAYRQFIEPVVGASGDRVGQTAH